MVLGLFGRKKEANDDEQDFGTTTVIKSHVNLELAAERSGQGSADPLKGKTLRDLLSTEEISEIDGVMNILFCPSKEQKLSNPSFCSINETYRSIFESQAQGKKEYSQNKNAGWYSLCRDIFGNKFKESNASVSLADLSGGLRSILNGKDMLSIIRHYVVAKYSATHYIPDVRDLIHLMNNPTRIPMVMRGRISVFPGTVVGIGHNLYVLAAYCNTRFESCEIVSFSDNIRNDFKLAPPYKDIQTTIYQAPPEDGHKVFKVSFLPMTLICREHVPLVMDSADERTFSKTRTFDALYGVQADNQRILIQAKGLIVPKSMKQDSFSLEDVVFPMIKR